MTVPTPARARPTARVLVLDPAGRVLLMSHRVKRRAWINPGRAAVEAGESLPAAAVDAVAVGRIVGAA